MSDASQPRRILAVLLSGVLLLSAVGCGVDVSSTPVDVGDGLGYKDNSRVVELPKPVSARAAGLVETFLKATAGGGGVAADNAASFFTEKEGKSWRERWKKAEDQESLTVIRVTNKIEDAGQQGGVLVPVEYQVVGTLTNRGQLEVVKEPAATPSRMTFTVVPDSSFGWRIESIDGNVPDGLFISDVGVSDYYWIDSIYFWDRTGTHLVPDLRYIPRTVNRNQRATSVVTMLIEGPSAMLGAVQRLRTGTAATSVVLSESSDTFEVKLTPNAIAVDNQEDAAKKLLWQLQWSLRFNNNTPTVNLVAGDFKRTVRADDHTYENFNDTDDLGSLQTFDIRAEKVVAVDISCKPVPTQPQVLTTKENKDVVAAAVNREADRIAYVVTTPAGSRQLTLIRPDRKVATSIVAFDLGRPSWIPGTDMLLVTANGNVRAVSGTSGQSTVITPSGLGPVTDLSVSPDGRRIALIAGNRLVVAQLGMDAGKRNISIEPEPQTVPISARLSAVGVAWSSEEWLKVVGTEGVDSVMYDVTADGVVARQTELKGFAPQGVVAFPSPDRPTTESYVLSEQGAYSSGQSESTCVAPFYAL